MVPTQTVVLGTGTEEVTFVSGTDEHKAHCFQLASKSRLNPGSPQGSEPSVLLDERVDIQVLSSDCK